MTVRRTQFSLKSLLLFVTLACLGARLISQVLDARARAEAQHRRSQQFIDARFQFSIEDRARRQYCLDRAAYHLKLAERYDRAVFQPWLSVEEPGAAVALLNLPKHS